MSSRSSTVDEPARPRGRSGARSPAPEPAPSRSPFEREPPRTRSQPSPATGLRRRRRNRRSVGAGRRARRRRARRSSFPPALDRAVVERCAASRPAGPAGCRDRDRADRGALARGVDVVKLFPAEALGGLDLIRALAAPFPEARFVPTGGLNAANAADYLALPSVLAIGGSWMVAPPLLAAGDFDDGRAADGRGAALSGRGAVTPRDSGPRRSAGTTSSRSARSCSASTRARAASATRARSGSGRAAANTTSRAGCGAASACGPRS